MTGVFEHHGTEITRKKKYSRKEATDVLPTEVRSDLFQSAHRWYSFDSNFGETERNSHALLAAEELNEAEYTDD